MNRPTTFAQAMDRIADLEERCAWLESELGIDRDVSRVWPLSRCFGLTGKEAELVMVLRSRAPAMVTNERLLLALYGGRDEPLSGIIKVFICKIRAKLPKAAWIKTVWGQGYALTDEGGAAIDDLLGVAARHAA